MFRLAAVAVLGLLTIPVPADAADPEVCLLDAKETLTAPKKANLFSFTLDCGSEPTREQSAAIVGVANKSNTVDALRHMVALGYEVEDSDHMPAWSGNVVHHYFTLVMEPPDAPEVDAPVRDEPIDAPSDELPEASDEELPEAGEGSDE